MDCYRKCKSPFWPPVADIRRMRQGSPWRTRLARTFTYLAAGQQGARCPSKPAASSHAVFVKFAARQTKEHPWQAERTVEALNTSSADNPPRLSPKSTIGRL